MIFLVFTPKSIYVAVSNAKNCVIHVADGYNMLMDAYLIDFHTYLAERQRGWMIDKNEAVLVLIIAVNRVFARSGYMCPGPLHNRRDIFQH